MPFYSVFDRHKFFHFFSPFQKNVWTILFPIDLENRGISEKEKDSFDGCLPQNCSKTSCSKFQTPKTPKNYRFALKPPKLPEGTLRASSSRRVLSHHSSSLLLVKEALRNVPERELPHQSGREEELKKKFDLLKFHQRNTGVNTRDLSLKFLEYSPCARILLSHLE